jgi:hypothetical protein
MPGLERSAAELADLAARYGSTVGFGGGQIPYTYVRL